MYRIVFIWVCFMVSSFQYKVKDDLLSRKTNGWLIFRENVGVLFAEDSISSRVNAKDFFSKYQYLNGIDVSNYASIYTFEGKAVDFNVTFWGEKAAERIKIIPVQLEVFSRKSSLGVDPNSWSFKRLRDSTIILFNSPDTLYVSNTCPYKKKRGDCYEIQACAK